MWIILVKECLLSVKSVKADDGRGLTTRPASRQRVRGWGGGGDNDNNDLEKDNIVTMRASERKQTILAWITYRITRS